MWFWWEGGGGLWNNPHRVARCSRGSFRKIYLLRVVDSKYIWKHLTMSWLFFVIQLFNLVRLTYCMLTTINQAVSVHVLEITGFYNEIP